MFNQLAKNIWVVDGGAVPFFGLPYTTRMTIIRLENNDLFIHSPIKPNPELVQEVSKLGNIKYLISPNKIHHLFLQDWLELYPNAEVYASPGLREKRKDINFTADLKDFPKAQWQNEIDQLIFKGSRVMQEVVFFHKPSKTLILTDLIENFDENYFTGFKGLIAKLSGIVAPNGKTPIDWRMSFFFGKKQARECFERILAWQPERIIVAHGKNIETNAVDFLKKSFKWLGK
ncbi:DUF4336 domain-containing protein [Francisella philomiragia]|uniref:DUF4336 domain-containing protein n=1 Tax=Francisella philomiragia TaxID=28110 RepID=UPI001906A671|nr:DUF4336 domain-containing protein [Francisella philomiragia]MBK2267145.1 DUF4336 domain-containing protein [Francisella philomiragia]MBK2278355.1 DUF4336 domain-containing protein [Francisella philomiragia]MBK2286455.1 DUF4336 domain-containing protein [Francisella philomiragia]MBK2288186.1 DUF4336 domain-containing protein [Francisella philomiragia]MBK2291513.1 DUF4336 domain-containing protein [Francisella philomiragia]